MKYFVNLVPYFNSRIVFSKENAKDEIGYTDEHHYFFNTEDFDFDKPLEKNEISVLFQKNQLFQSSVECLSQEVNVPEIICNKILIAGFATWGFFKEEFLLIFSDGSMEKANANFSDLCWPLFNAAATSLKMEQEMFNDASKIIYGPKKVNDVDRYVYYYTTEFQKKGRKLKKIIFPDNFLMHILAITLED